MRGFLIEGLFGLSLLLVSLLAGGQETLRLRLKVWRRRRASGGLSEVSVGPPEASSDPAEVDSAQTEHLEVPAPDVSDLLTVDDTDVAASVPPAAVPMETRRALEAQLRRAVSAAVKRAQPPGAP